MAERSGSMAPVLERALGRFRHGLVIQEILDRLARRGVFVWPYLVTRETGTTGNRPADRTGVVRWLGPQDAADIAGISLRALSEARVIESLARSRCMGIFFDGRLAGYTWTSQNNVTVPDSGGAPLFALRADEAYLFDMFINPEYRGARLAPLLRAHLLHALGKEGKTQCFSITLAFNRSSRRFKARLEAREVELRLYLHLRVGRMPGVDLRLWRRRPHARTVFARKVPCPPKARDAL